MAKNHINKVKLQERYSFALTTKQHMNMALFGIKPEHFRAFIEDFGNGGRKKIRSGDWKELKNILIRAPSLQLIGDIGAGKTYLTKELIRKDNDHIYIVLDSHDEFDFLPTVNTIVDNMTESSRIEMPKAPEGAIGMFKVYYNLLMNNKFPKHYVLAVDEAMRYEKAGIKNLLAETRKFLKVLAVTQEKIVDFCPWIELKPYHDYKV